jgi:dTMP kinase
MKISVPRLTSASAQIVDGLFSETSEGLDIPALLAYWEENKYPLLALNHSNGLQQLQDSAEFKAARQQQEELLSSARAEYIIVRDRWAREGISCILIKSAGRFPSFPYTSDNLDVLVKEEHEQAARAILRELGYIELKNIEESHKFLFRKFHSGRCVSAIHLHTWVGWDACFLDDEPIWQNSRIPSDDGAVCAPSPEDVILITIAHGFYENKRFRLGDIAKIRECWREDAVDWAYLEKAASQRGWLDGLLFCLLVCAHIEKLLWGETSIPVHNLNGWETSLKRHPIAYRYYRRITRRTPVSLPYTFSFVFSKFLYYGKVLRDQRHSLREKLTEAVQTLAGGIKLKSGIRPQPAFLVSFSGPDGSGKTEHAQALIRALCISELRIKYYWNRCATFGLTRFFSHWGKVLLGNGIPGTKPGASGRRERLQNPLLRFLWSYLVAADMVLAYFFKVKLPLLYGKIVVCDRYVFDAAAEMESSLTAKDRLSQLAIKLMLALVPKPDVAYLLDLPEDVCAQRKDEDTNPDYLRQQRRVYMALADRYDLRLKRTDREFGTTADEIVHEVMVPYYKNFGTFLNGIFLSNPSQLNKRNRGEE